MTYIVQPGDSLYNIAVQFHTTTETISAANGIVNPTLIYPGQTLEIPSTSNPPGEGFMYFVQPGDSLYEIAKRYEIALRELISINHILAPYIIYPGQSLWIPKPVPEPHSRNKIYIVQMGDTVYSIATQFHVPIEDVIQWNNISRPDLIYPGQQLLLPYTSSDQTS